jgi:hypothetical protein
VAELPGGYAFKLDTTMNELKAKLAALGHGEWQDWESNSYGDYIFGYLWGVRMRIYDGQGTQSDFGTYDPGGYMLLDYARGEWDKRSEELHIRIVDILFPALGITEWKPDVGNE